MKARKMIIIAIVLAMAGMEWNHPRYSRQALKTAGGYKPTYSCPKSRSAYTPTTDILGEVWNVSR